MYPTLTRWEMNYIVDLYTKLKNFVRNNKEWIEKYGYRVELIVREHWAKICIESTDYYLHIKFYVDDGDVSAVTVCERISWTESGQFASNDLIEWTPYFKMEELRRLDILPMVQKQLETRATEIYGWFLAE